MIIETGDPYWPFKVHVADKTPLNYRLNWVLDYLKLKSVIYGNEAPFTQNTVDSSYSFKDQEIALKFDAQFGESNI